MVIRAARTVLFFILLPLRPLPAQASREQKFYDRTQLDMAGKFDELEQQFENLVQAYDQAKMESRDSPREWKAIAEKWKRGFGDPSRYALSRSPNFPNLRTANIRLKDVARDMLKYVRYLGRHVDEERDQKTIGLEESIENRINGLREFLAIPVPAVKNGWATAGPIRWRLIAARKKTRDRRGETRLCTFKVQAEIQDAEMKLIEIDSVTLITESGEKLHPVADFQASFSYSERERPPYGDYVEPGKTLKFTFVIKVPENTRDCILRLSDLEKKPKEFAYLSVRL